MLNTSIGIPEGWLLLPLLFLFPYMLARKGLFNIETIIQSYMQDSERLVIYIWVLTGNVYYNYIQKFINTRRYR